MKELYKIFLDGLVKYGEEPPVDFYVGSNYENNWMRDIGDRISDFAFAYNMTGDKKYFEYGLARVKKAMTYPSWGQGNAENKDLACAHMLVGISIFYDWCYDTLSKQDREDIVSILKERGGIMRGGGWWKRTYLQNHLWHSVDSVAVTAAAIYDVAPDVVEWIPWTIEKYENVFYYLGDDGATHEGYTYWRYGIKPMVFFVLTAKKFFNKDFTDAGYLRKTWEYGVHDMVPYDPEAAQNVVFPFGDSAIGQTFEAMGPLGYLAGLNNRPEALWGANHLRDFYIKSKQACSWHCFVFYPYDMEEKTPEELNYSTTKVFDDLGYVFSRSDWGKDASAIAFRCGPVMGEKVAHADHTYNFGTGHTHSDVGHMSIYANGEWILGDDGYVKNYTAQHNTLLVNGRGQVGDGGTWDDEAVSAMPEIETVSLNDSYDYFVLNATEAYPKSVGLKNFKRHMVFLKRGMLLVVDEIECEGSNPLELRFHPDLQTSFLQSDNTYIFVGKKNKYSIKPFLPKGATTVAEMDRQTANKTGGYKQRYVIKLKNTAKKWLQATAISWCNKSEELGTVGLQQADNIFKFTAGKFNVKIDIGANTAEVSEMTYPINLKYNDVFVPFGDAPVIENGRMLVPYTELIDVLNMTTDFSKNKRDIRFEGMGKTIEMKLLSNKIKVDGKESEMDAIPTMRNGSLYIPVRPFFNALGFNVAYDDATKVASVQSEVSAELGILGIFVGDMTATPDENDESKFTCTTLASDNLDINVIPLASGTKINIERSEGIFGDQKIILSSVDGSVSKEYTLTLNQVKGLGEYGIMNMKYSDHDGNIGENTMDGNLDTRWSASGTQWILYDFGEEKEIGSIDIAFYAGNKRKTFFEIQTSDDGENFTTVLDTESSGLSVDMEKFKLKDKVKTKYIRFFGKGNSSNAWNSLSEVAFFNE